MARNYGGAFDIDPQMYFTKEEIDEFAWDVCDTVSERMPEHTFGVDDVYIETDGDKDTLVIEVSMDSEYGVAYAQRIDYRRIHHPDDLYKYEPAFVDEFVGYFSNLIEEIMNYD